MNEIRCPSCGGKTTLFEYNDEHRLVYCPTCSKWMKYDSAVNIIQIRCPLCGTDAMRTLRTLSGRYYIQCSTRRCGMRTKTYPSKLRAVEAIAVVNEREDKLLSDAKELRRLNASLVFQNSELHKEVAKLNRTINTQQVERRTATEDGICQRAGWYKWIAGEDPVYITDSDQRMNSIIETCRKLAGDGNMEISDVIYIPSGVKLPRISPGMMALFGIKEE